LTFLDKRVMEILYINGHHLILEKISYTWIKHM